MHADDTLPTEPDVRGVVARFQWAPSVEVETGHGLQLYWVLESAVSPVRGMALTDRLHLALRNAGVKPERRDLASVLRVPGTFNFKAEPVEVRAFAGCPGRYVPENLERHLPRLPERRPVVGCGDDRVREAFNAAHDVVDILRGRGWSDAGASDGRAHLTRPGKSSGKSATIYEDGRACIWSSNAAPFAEREVVDAFAAFAELVHDGDWSAARRRARDMYPDEARQDTAAWGALPTVISSSTGQPDVDERSSVEAGAEVEALAGVDGLRYTHAGNAKRITLRHGDNVRYVPKWQTWLVYHDGRWIKDVGATIVGHLAATLAVDLFGRINGASNVKVGESRQSDRDRLIAWARTCESAATIAATINVLRTMPGIAIDHSALDRDPWILNVRNGTIDLRTGILRAHDPADLCQWQAPVDYDPTAEAPMFEQFLADIQPDEDVRRFMQRLLALAVIGEQPEHVLPIGWGQGRNGKSTLTDIIAAALGDYATAVSSEVFTLDRNGSKVHGESIASLFGRRFAHAGELEEGAALRESLVKQLTGNDTITCRRIYEHEWTFKPSHLLWLHSNKRPSIAGTDFGIWRRVVLIPFTVRIPDDKVDPGLGARIIATELPGVLRWLLDGLAEYQAHGLMIPEAVRVASEGYRQSQDTVARFIADTGLRFAAGTRTKITDLMSAHSQWYETAGIDTYGGARGHWGKLREHLIASGCSEHRTKRDRWIRGVEVPLDELGGAS